MINKKKFTIILILIVVMLLICGCTKRQIISRADELMASSWQASDKYDKYIKLTFDKNNADITLKTTDFEGKISGKVMIDDNFIQISDDNLKEKFTFGYVVYGNKIELSYNENVLELYKINQ